MAHLEHLFEVCPGGTPRAAKVNIRFRFEVTGITGSRLARPGPLS
jgi:hypothetical protein